jgi:hypothetical protein
MNPLVAGFKACAHQAATTCGVRTGTLIREYGLNDFLENGIAEGDDAPTVAVKALAYFRDDGGPGSTRFRFTVLAVGAFLHQYHAGRKGDSPVQALRDLVSILLAGGQEGAIRGWISSHYG